MAYLSLMEKSGIELDSILPLMSKILHESLTRHVDSVAYVG
jgi:hypothetical protein